MATTSADVVWTGWVSDTSATTAYISANTIWQYWVDERYNTTSTTTYQVAPRRDSEHIWKVWVSDSTSTESYEFVEPTIIRAAKETAIIKPLKPKLTTEQKRAQHAQAAITIEWRKLLNAEKEQIKIAAENTAQELLLELIGDDKFKRYKETGSILIPGKKQYDYVISKCSGVYRVKKSSIIDFVKYKKQVKGQGICIHMVNRHKYPQTDNVIALKMLLESDERRFNKIGNLSNHHTNVNNLEKLLVNQ